MLKVDFSRPARTSQCFGKLMQELMDALEDLQELHETDRPTLLRTVWTSSMEATSCPREFLADASPRNTSRKKKLVALISDMTLEHVIAVIAHSKEGS